MRNAAVETVITTNRLDTSELPVEGQFSAWAAHTANTRLTPRAPGAFLAQGAFWDLGLVVVAESRLDGFTAERDAALLHATTADHYLLVALFEGDTHFRTADVDVRCRSGSAFVCDFSRPSLLTTAGVHCASVMFPRAFVETAVGAFPLHGPLPAGAPTDLLVGTLRSLTRKLPELPATSAGFYAHVVRDLLAAAVPTSSRHDVAGDASRRSAVAAYLQRQPPGSLSVEALAAAMRLSRATLYRLFRGDGGVVAYDRLRRLRALHHDLADPQERRTAAELGAMHGFFDQSYLTRLFRATFGYSMGDLRRRLAALDMQSSAPFPEKLRAVVGRLSTGREAD